MFTFLFIFFFTLTFIKICFIQIFWRVSAVWLVPFGDIIGIIFISMHQFLNLIAETLFFFFIHVCVLIIYYFFFILINLSCDAVV